MGGYKMKNIYRFLDAIAENNNRPWLAAHNDEYQELRRQWFEDLDKLIACMSSWQPDFARQTGRDAAYRFARDTRFSPDKSPYKTFFSAAISPYGRKSERAAYYLQVDSRREENGLYGGMYCLDAPMLAKLRRAIVDNSEEFEEIVNNPELQRLYPGWLGEQLKTAPKGWPKDHPQIEYLRLKYYGKFHHCDRRYFESERWYERASEDFRVLKPLIDFLNYSYDEEF